MERFGFNIWTKNLPKDYLKLYVNYSKIYNSQLIAIIDDILPEVKYSRSTEETLYYNDIYKEFFFKLWFDNIFFVSENLNRDLELLNLIKHLDNITIHNFISLLPEKKRYSIDNLTLAEILETSWQIHVLSEFNKKLRISKWLIWERSLALYNHCKNKIKDFNFITINN